MLLMCLYNNYSLRMLACLLCALLRMRAMNVVMRYGVVIVTGPEVELTVDAMSDLEEEAAAGLDSSENMSAERTSLMVDKEVRSTCCLMKVRSSCCKFGLFQLIGVHPHGGVI